MKPTQTHTPEPSEADIYFMFQHYNLTDEEEDSLKPWSYYNTPLAVSREHSSWRYFSWGAEGPRLTKVSGYTLRFRDGSAYRIAENWEIGEVLSSDQAGDR